jgi:hypothetical protein
VELSKTNLELDTEILDLRTEILKLKNDVLRMKAENLQLAKSDLKRSQELAGVEEQNLKLEQELKDLRHAFAIQRPLIEVRVAVRLKFLEEAKEYRGLGLADKLIVGAGNRAVREGALLADAALFDLGYIAKLSPRWLRLDLGYEDSEASDTECSNLGSLTAGDSDAQLSNIPDQEQLSRTFYNYLYTIPLHGVKDFPFSPEAIELFNMSATMSSCSSSFVPKAVLDEITDARSSDDECFCALATRWAMGVDNQGFHNHNTEMDEIFGELREITNRAVREKFRTRSETACLVEGG